MKKIILQFRIKIETLREKIKIREDKFYEKSERWQISEIGEEYEYRTQELTDKVDELENLIDEFEELL